MYIYIYINDGDDDSKTQNHSVIPTEKFGGELD